MKSIGWNIFVLIFTFYAFFAFFIVVFLTCRAIDYTFFDSNFEKYILYKYNKKIRKE